MSDIPQASELHYIGHLRSTFEHLVSDSFSLEETHTTFPSTPALNPSCTAIYWKGTQILPDRISTKGFVYSVGAHDVGYLTITTR